MSDHTLATGRLSGNALIAVSAFGQWLLEHGLSNAMVWIAIVGLVLNLLTSLPALDRSFHQYRQWRGKEKR